MKYMEITKEDTWDLEVGQMIQTSDGMTMFVIDPQRDDRTIFATDEEFDEDEADATSGWIVYRSSIEKAEVLE